MSSGHSDRFDVTLRRLMMHGRPAAAPGALQTRVMRLPDDQPVQVTRSRNAWLLGAARAAAVLVIVAIAAVVVVVGLSSTPSDPGMQVPTVPPATTGFDPSIDGIGIVGEVGETRRTLPWILAVIAGGGFVLLSLRYGRVGRLMAVAAAASALGVAYFVTADPGVVRSFANGAPLGIEIEEAPSVTNGPDAYHVTAEPNENFSVTFNLRNAGSLPIRLLGVIDHSGGQTRQLRWTALGFERSTGGFGGLQAMRPFEPIDVAPGEVVNLWLVGRASICSVGTSGSPSTVGVGMRPIEVAFTMLGMPDSSVIDLPFVVAEARRDDCTGEF